MAKTDPINTANPAGADDPRNGDDVIRTLAKAVIEILGIDHYVGPSSPYNLDAAGEHKRIKFQAGYAGSGVAGCLYTSGTQSIQGSLCFTNLSGDNIILTSGTQKIVNDSLLSHGQSIKSVNATELVKCSGEVVILASGSLLVTDVAPTVNTAIPNKKYVDDQIDAHANTNPVTISTGGLTDWLAASASESKKITHPNGLIEVFGYHKKTGATGTAEDITISSHGFSKILYASVTPFDKTNSSQSAYACINALSTTTLTFTCEWGGAVFDGVFYRVVGY